MHCTSVSSRHPFEQQAATPEHSSFGGLCGRQFGGQQIARFVSRESRQRLQAPPTVEPGILTSSTRCSGRCSSAGSAPPAIGAATAEHLDVRPRGGEHRPAAR